LTPKGDSDGGIPDMPKFNITRLNVHEIPGSEKGMAANVSVLIENQYPVNLTVPPMAFAVSVENCRPEQAHITVVEAQIQHTQILPRHDILVNASGTVRELPDELTGTCPGTRKSPLDTLVQGYISGKTTTVYVRGSDSPHSKTPQWITELISGIVVPVPFPGHSFDNLISNFTLADVHFSLPDMDAEPDTPESNPMISAMIKVLANLPGEMNFPIDVNRVRARADVFYKGKIMGKLNLDKWQMANSTRVEADGKNPPALFVESAIKNAPLEIVDDEAFTSVVQALLFGGKTVYLKIKANVDIKLDTALGNLTVSSIPAEGIIPVKRGLF
jgi:hypothetical protein